MTASAALATASTAIVHGNVKVNEEANPESLAAKKNMLLKHLLKEEKEETDAKQPPKEKKALSDRYGRLLHNYVITAVFISAFGDAARLRPVYVESQNSVDL